MMFPALSLGIVGNGFTLPRPNRSAKSADSDRGHWRFYHIDVGVPQWTRPAVKFAEDDVGRERSKQFWKKAGVAADKHCCR